MSAWREQSLSMLLGAGCVLGCAACAADGADSGCAACATVEVDAVLGTVSTYQSQLVSINDEPVASLALGAPVRVWASTDVAEAYRRLDPLDDGAIAVVEEGATLVREVLATDGTVTKLTVLYKGPPDYRPDAGNLWFAVTTPSGDALAEGALEECFACHVTRASNGYLFGLHR